MFKQWGCMRSRLLAGLIGYTALTALAAPGFAADLAHAPATPVFSWTGNYLGVEAGYGWANSTYSDTTNAFQASPNPRGALGGIFSGYSYEFSNHIVVGLESDIGLSSIGASNVIGNFAFTPVGARETWSTTTRARIGYAFDRFLPYVAVGSTFANVSHSVSDTRFANSGVTWSDIRSGISVAGGLDYAITDRLIARIEYRYDDFGSMSYLGTASGGVPVYLPHKLSLNSSDVRVGLAYKLDDEGAAPTSAAAGSVHNWAGYYVGADGGYNWGTSSYTVPSSGFRAGLNPRGGLVGGFGGDNYQFANNVVLGAEGDFNFTNASVSNAFGSALGVPNTINAHGEKLNWSSTTRARLGYAWNQFLPFVTAGVAFEKDSVSDQNLAVANSGVSWSEIRLGYTLGAGLEYAITDKISTRVEYRFADYGTDGVATTISTATGSQYAAHKVNLSTNDVRVGLSYKLN